MDKQQPEHLLQLLAQGASLCSKNRALAFPLLQRACALLWRLEPVGYPMSAIELERKLSVPLEDWLPSAIRAEAPYCIPTSPRKPAMRCCLSST